MIGLLSFGADFTKLDAHNNTPLHYAVMAKSASIVQMLLCFGADPHIKNLNNQSPISMPTT